MRIFALLTAVIEQAVPACSEESCATIVELLTQQDVLLANNETLSEAARAEMIASLREELTWRVRLHAEPTGLKLAATQWMAAQQEMLRRLEQDRSQLEVQFFAGRAAGQIAAIVPELSDRHEGAHAVAILTFASGDRVVYKPRPLETECWFYCFLAQVNELAPPFSFATLKTLSCEGYGWVEFAAHRSCADEAELRDYYRHAGALLCVLRLLRAGDCHFQNLIACGSQPVLVDAETLLQPNSDGKSEFAIVDTAMLPPLGRPYDLGALSCITPQQVVLDLPGLTPSPVVLTPRENLPFREEESSSPHLFVEEMAEGFAATWHFLAGHRGQIADLLTPARDLPIRILSRDTAEYYRQMLLFGLGMETDPALSAAELAALRRFEVPRFTTENGSAASGFEAVLTELAALDNAGLERQLKMLRLLWTIYGGMRGFMGDAVKMATV